MTLTGYDDVSVGNYPPDAQVALGYVDGRWPTFNQGLAQQCPHAFLVSITVIGGDADVCDIESGDLTPDGGARWIEARKRQGKRAIAYCSLSEWGAVRQACANLGVAPDGYWIACYDGDPNIPQTWVAMGCVGKQYQSSDRFDINTILDTWPGLTAPAAGYLPSDWMIWAA